MPRCTVSVRASVGFQLQVSKILVLQQNREPKPCHCDPARRQRNLLLDSQLPTYQLTNLSTSPCWSSACFSPCFLMPLIRIFPSARTALFSQDRKLPFTSTPGT